jgi:uncharacterized membrane protein
VRAGTPSEERTAAGFHPCQLLLTGFASVLFLGGLLSDVAYARSYQIQWLNFAAWLLAGGMVFVGLALAWSLVEVALGPARRGRRLISALLLLAAFVVGLLDCFMHARDAWGAMPAGLVQSAVAMALLSGALWIGAFRPGRGVAA